MDEQVHQRTFRGEPAELAKVRRFARRSLPPDCPMAADFVLLDEVAANAVLHSDSGRPGGVFEVTIRHRADALRAEIADAGSPSRPRAPPPPDWSHERGRGLLLVSMLATGWGIPTPAARSPGVVRAGPRPRTARGLAQAQLILKTRLRDVQAVLPAPNVAGAAGHRHHRGGPMEAIEASPALSPRYGRPYRRTASGTPVHAGIRSGQAATAPPAPTPDSPTLGARPPSTTGSSPRTGTGGVEPQARGCRRGPSSTLWPIRPIRRRAAGSAPPSGRIPAG